MVASLQAALQERYTEAVEAGNIFQEVMRRDGTTAPQVEHRISGSNIFIRTLPQIMSWHVTVGDYQGHQIEMPLGKDLTFSAEPVNLLVERPVGQTFVAARDQLSPVGKDGVGYLKDLVEQSEVAPQNKTKPLRGINVAELAAHDPETGLKISVSNLARSLMETSRMVHRAGRRGVFAEYDLGPLGQGDQDSFSLRTWATHPLIGADLVLEAGIDTATQRLTKDDVMCSMQFRDLQSWETQDGLIVAEGVDLLLEDTEAIMLNDNNEAGFSHLATESLARVYEILRNARPTTRPQ